MTLGLDLSDGLARAIVVDAQAHVVARGALAIAGGGHATAAEAVLAEVLAGATAPVARAAVALSQVGDGLPPDVDALFQKFLPGTGTPVVAAAGTAAVVAEQWCGAARGLSSVVAFSAGEHLTSGIMLDGRIWPGAHGLAGSIAWLSVNPAEREDYRRLGGLAADTSAGGIVRRVIWRIKSGDDSVLVHQHRGDLTKITIDEVFQCARSGDGLCLSVARDTARFVGMAVSNVAAVLDPQIVVLGGLLATAGDLLLEPIRQECARRLSHTQADRLQVVLSTLGADAVAIGAARLAAVPA